MIMYLHIICETWLIINIAMVQNFEFMFDKFYIGKIYA
jgi:hypothetical protein